MFGKIRHILIMQNRKRIIIVGATSGLGRGLAECYISKGCQVGIVGRRSEILAEMAEGRQNVYNDDSRCNRSAYGDRMPGAFAE